MRYSPNNFKQNPFHFFQLLLHQHHCFYDLIFAFLTLVIVFLTVIGMTGREMRVGKMQTIVHHPYAVEQGCEEGKPNVSLYQNNVD